jgi:single-strand DNA-binding protein
MARSFNQVILMGNLTRDPEVRQIPSGQSVCSFSLALNRSFKGAEGEWQEATDYIDVVAWGPLGERIAQYLTKGSRCLVQGRIQSRSWEQDGQKRSKVEVNANDVTFLDSRSAGGDSEGGSGFSRAPQGDSGGGARQAAPAKKPATKEAVVEDIGDEPINLDDIPF